MVYDSDFYTTRRPYRTSPSLSSYTASSVPSRQVRILPGLGKVHIVHTYDRIVPYVGHKRLTVVSMPPRVYSTRPSILNKEYDWIENKVRPRVGYSATNRYLNSNSAVRMYYLRYPISGSYYHTVNVPSSSYYYPKIYRWYYDSPSTYSSYYWPSSYYNWPRSYLSYWPYYRSYLGSYLRNYYLSYWPSLYYRSVHNDFNELENKISNLSRMIYMNYPIRGIDYPYYPESTTKYYRPLTLYYNYYWPIRSLNYYSDIWPNYPYYRYLYYKYTLPSDRYYHLKGIFDDETRLIRAQTASLLRRVHDPVPRVQRFSWPLSTTTRYDDSLPARFSSDNYIHRMLTTSPRNEKVQYTTYYSEPVRKYIGQGHLACASYAGDHAYSRRKNLYLYEDPLKSDIQLLSYYITKFRQEKATAASTDSSKVALSPARPSRKFSAKREEDDSSTRKEMEELRKARAARLAFINEEEKIERTTASKEVDQAVKAKKQQEEARLAEENAIAEEQTRKAAQTKKDEEARRVELARQEELAAQAAAERAAELERQAELTKQKEAKQAEIEKRKKEEEERLRLEEQQKLEDEAKAEEERQQLLRLEEIARQAEEDKEAELVRQAEELAELARQEAELAEQAKKEGELEELARQEAELEELKRQEEELAELEEKEKELAEQAEAAKKEAELEEIAQQEAELAELERQQAELDALEAEAKAFEADVPQSEEQEAEAPQEEEVKDDEEEAKRQAELEELQRQEEELAELERAQAELDALEAEAKALEADVEPTATAADDDDDEPQAIAEDVPGVQSDAEEEVEDDE